jgi:hypothetical protein
MKTPKHRRPSLYYTALLCAFCVFAVHLPAAVPVYPSVGIALSGNVLLANVTLAGGLTNTPRTVSSAAAPAPASDSPAADSAASLFASGDDLLLYALTDNYTLTADARPTSNGTLSHIPPVILAGGNLSITFTPLRPAFEYTVQYSTDLQTWTDISTTNGGSDQPQTVQIPTSSYPRLFMRLKITNPNALLIDVDKDGLPDLWEKFYFPSILSINATSDYNGDGISDLNALIHDLDPRYTIAQQPDGAATNHFIYDARSRLISATTQASGITLTLDAETNLQSATITSQ